MLIFQINAQNYLEPVQYKPHVPRIIQIVVPGEFIVQLSVGWRLFRIFKANRYRITITEAKDDKGEPIGMVDIFGVDKEDGCCTGNIKAIVTVPKLVKSIKAQWYL